MADRFGFISTYPPTQCGFATFTASLLGALKRSGVSRGGWRACWTRRNRRAAELSWRTL
jgi:hypothetical protein